MKLSVHKTRSGLWCAISLLVFVAIGMLIRIEGKGETVSLFWAISEGIGNDLRQGRTDFLGSISFFVFLGIWALVATVIGWLLHSLLVLIFDWRRAKADVPDR